MTFKSITAACDAFIKTSLWSDGTVMNIEEAMEKAINAYSMANMVATTQFDFKSTGAIVAPRYEDIPIVIRTIRDMDIDEYNRYYPEGLVTAQSELGFRTRTTYIHKFEIDLKELYTRCAKVGILIKAIQERTVTSDINICGIV